MFNNKVIIDFFLDIEKFDLNATAMIGYTISSSTFPFLNNQPDLPYDKDGNEIAKMKERRAKGIHIIYDDSLTKHNEEAVVDSIAGAIIIDTMHPFWLRCKNNHVLGNFNEMRIVLEALIKYKNDELDWDVKKTLEEYRDLVHKIWI